MKECISEALKYIRAAVDIGFAPAQEAIGYFYENGELVVERDQVVEDWLLDCCAIDVEDADFFGCGKNAPAGHHGQLVLVRHSWREIKSSSALASGNV